MCTVITGFAGYRFRMVVTGQDTRCHHDTQHWEYNASNAKPMDNLHHKASRHRLTGAETVQRLDNGIPMEPVLNQNLGFSGSFALKAL